MPNRTLTEIRNQPCKYKLKDMPRKNRPAAISPDNVQIQNGVRKVKKVIQKKDEQGNPLFKTIKVEKTKGCGCKGRPKTKVVEEKRVPDTIEVWVDEPILEKAPPTPPPAPQQEERQVLCKLYGTVPEDYCQRCKTYKK